LADKIDSLGFRTKCLVDTLSDKESIAIFSLSGGQTKFAYYDETENKSLPFDIAIKTKDMQFAYQTLNQIARELDGIKVLKSLNDSFVLDSISVRSEPNKIGSDTDEYSIHVITIMAELTILEEEI